MGSYMTLDENRVRGVPFEKKSRRGIKIPKKNSQMCANPSGNPNYYKNIIKNQPIFQFLTKII